MNPFAAKIKLAYSIPVIVYLPTFTAIHTVWEWIIVTQFVEENVLNRSRYEYHLADQKKNKLKFVLVDSFADIAISFIKTGVMIQPMIGGKLDDPILLNRKLLSVDHIRD